MSEIEKRSLIHDDPRALRIVSEFTQYPANFVPLKGGRSQAALYRFDTLENSYVIRLFAPQAKKLTCEHQILLAKQAGKIGVGPNVLYVDLQLEGLIIEFIPGRTVTPIDFEDPNKLANFAKILRSLHYSSESFPIAISPFHRFHAFAAMKSPQLNKAKTIMEHLEKVLQYYPVANVPTHLDLNSLNIMLANERFYLVDWVNGGMSDPYFDLATFAIFHNLTETQSRSFLKHYFDRNPTQLEWNRFVITQPIRLLVIAAALLSSEDILRDLPNLDAFTTENAAGRTTQSHHEIGSIMFNGAINLIEGNNFQKALNDLEKDV